MPANRQLNDLAHRKRLLILEAALNREVIGTECADLRSRFDWLQGARSHWAVRSPWLAAGGTLAGLIAARRWRKLAVWIPAVLATWRAVRRHRST